MEEAPKLAQKFIILEGCISDVTGFSHLSTPIDKEAKIEEYNLQNQQK